MTLKEALMERDGLDESEAEDKVKAVKGIIQERLGDSIDASKIEEIEEIVKEELDLEIVLIL